MRVFLTIIFLLPVYSFSMGFDLKNQDDCEIFADTIATINHETTDTSLSSGSLESYVDCERTRFFMVLHIPLEETPPSGEGFISLIRSQACTTDQHWPSTLNSGWEIIGIIKAGNITKFTKTIKTCDGYK